MTFEATTEMCNERPEASADETLRPLLLAVSEGCSASFATLYAHTHRRIFGIVLRIVRHRAEAEEVLQEIYLKVWSRSRQFDASRGLVIYWLVGIAQRAAIDSLRRAASRPRESSDDTDAEDAYELHASPEPGPLEKFEQAQTQRLVVSQLSTLSPDQRESLVLAFVDGLTHAQIASRLACPLGTIKARIRRALASMRPALQSTQ